MFGIPLAKPDRVDLLVFASYILFIFVFVLALVFSGIPRDLAVALAGGLVVAACLDLVIVGKKQYTVKKLAVIALMVFLTSTAISSAIRGFGLL